MKGSFAKTGELAMAVLLCLAAGGTGAPFAAISIPVWYASIEKPWFNPPDWIFGPMWLTLYTMMGVSIYLVWRERDAKPVGLSLYMFVIQLVLNTLWAPVFFGAHMIFPALIISVLLLVSICAAIAVFYRISKPAAALLIPYFLWVSFATVLNYSIWRLNIH